MNDLYKKIKALREQNGLSQEELAKMTGYTSRSSIAKIEKGEVDLTQSKIIAFAKALKTTPQYLMGWDGQYILGSELKKLLTEISIEKNISYDAIVDLIFKSKLELPDDKKELNKENIIYIIDNYYSEEINTIAAHFDGTEFTDTELDDIANYIEFVKSKKS